MYSKAVETSSNAMGTLQEQQDIYMESTEAHLKKLSTEAEKTYDILFDTESVNSMTDAVTGLLDIFNNFLAGIGGGTQALATFGVMFTNLFKNQIASGINTAITNTEPKTVVGKEIVRQNTAVQTVEARKPAAGRTQKR